MSCELAGKALHMKTRATASVTQCASCSSGVKRREAVKHHAKRRVESGTEDNINWTGA